jgi:hypothetical protein
MSREFDFDYGYGGCGCLEKAAPGFGLDPAVMDHVLALVEEHHLRLNGILNTKADEWVHFGVLRATLFIYNTRAVLPVLTKDQLHIYKEEGIVTAVGFRVPIGIIPGLRRLPIPEKLLAAFFLPGPRRELDLSLGTSAKGRLAEKGAREILGPGFPLPVDWEVSTTRDSQFICDMTATVKNPSPKVEVKCDVRANPNLYLQAAESNKEGKH